MFPYCHFLEKETDKLRKLLESAAEAAIQYLEDVEKSLTAMLRVAGTVE